MMTPFEMLGFRQAVRTPRPVVGIFIFETAIVGIIVLGAVWALWAERRRAAIFHAAAAFVVLGSYAVAYWTRGFSYEQWKWISFFQPMLVAGVFALVAAAAGVLVTRWRPTPRLQYRLVAAVLGVALIAASARTLALGTRDFRAVWVKGEPTLAWSVVGSRLSDLAERPALTHLKAVNVDMQQWDAEWAAYFLAPTTRVSIVSRGNFPVARPSALWTLKCVRDPAAPYDSARYRYVEVKRVPPPAKNGSPRVPAFC
jgi:hypothetical protein